MIALKQSESIFFIGSPSKRLFPQRIDLKRNMTRFLLRMRLIGFVRILHMLIKPVCVKIVLYGQQSVHVFLLSRFNNCHTFRPLPKITAAVFSCSQTVHANFLIVLSFEDVPASTACDLTRLYPPVHVMILLIQPRIVSVRFGVALSAAIYLIPGFFPERFQQGRFLLARHILPVSPVVISGDGFDSAFLVLGC